MSHDEAIDFLLDAMPAEAASSPPIEAVPAGPLVFLHAEAPDEIDPAIEAIAKRLQPKAASDPLILALATAMCREHLEGWGRTEDLPQLYVMLRRVQDAATIAIEYTRNAGLENQVQAGPLDIDGYTLSYSSGGERADLRKLRDKIGTLPPEEAAHIESCLKSLNEAETEAKAVRSVLNPIAKRVGATSPARSSIALTRRKEAQDER